MTRVRFLATAEQELLNGALYYDRLAPGLGAEFLDAVDAAAEGIREAPELWPVLRDETRRRMLRRFPYALLYRIEPDAIVVVAVMHLRRRPDYWTDRIR